MNEIIETLGKVYPAMTIERFSVNLLGEPIDTGDNDPTEIELNIRLVRK